MFLSKATYSAISLYIYCQYVCSLGIEPTTFALLTQCSTTEPQEHAYPSTPENGTNVQKKNAARKHARHYNMIRSLVYSVFNSKSG